MPRKKRSSPFSGLPGGGGEKSVEASWVSADMEVLGELVQACAEKDVAVMFGRSRDKAVLMLKFYWDDLSETVWISPVDDVGAKLSDLIRHFGLMPSE